MSFYDDASLVFLPSGGAGKDGKAYSIKPVPEYGTELVTNGGFDTDSDWTFIGSANIANGVANFTATSEYIVQNNAIPLSVKTYKIQYEVVSSNNGQLRFAGGSSAFPTTTLPSSVGVHTVTAVSNGTKGSLQFNSNGFVGSIDNVSVREVIVDGDFTFSRGSNLTATRVDSNGLIEKGRENLLLQSNNFGDTAWVQSQTSRSSGQEGYDGSNDAWEVTRASGGSLVFLQSISTSGVNTFSVYVKVNASNGFGIRFGSSSYAYFDISDTTKNAAAATNSIVTSNQTYIGNNFYRLSVTASGSFSEVRLVNCTADGTLADSLGFTHIIQDAQVEIGTISTEYIESGASTGLAGILEDSPRFDYSGGASCPSLLLEPSRTNILEFSEYFEDSFYIKDSGVTATSNQVISPEGINNGSLISVQSSGRLYANHTSGTYISSVFIKAGTFSHFKIIGQNVDLTTSPISVGSLDFEDYGNGWYRIYGSYTGNRGFQVQAYPDNTYSSHTDSGDYYIFGAQVEAGSYPTSYIPNHSGGSVTRDADVCSGAGDSSTFNDSEGVLYAEIAALANDGNIRYLSLSDGGSNNRVVILFDSAADRIRAIVSSGGVKYFDENTESYDVLNYNKIAVRYKQADFSLWVNGTNVASVSSGSAPIGLNELSYNLGGSNTIFSKSKQLIVFNTALSTTDCEILTGATSYESFSAMSTALNYTTYE